MRVKRMLLMGLAMCAVLTAGCWDSRDANQKMLVTLVLTDRESDQFVFYIEAPRLEVGQGAEGEAEEYFVIRSEGATYAEARRALNVKTDSPIYLGTVRATVLTEGLARNGIDEYMFRMENMPDYRKTLDIITTRSPAAEFMSAKTDNSASVGDSVRTTLESLKQEGKSLEYKAGDVLQFMYAGYCFVLPNMDILDGEATLTGYSIFHDAKYIDFIPLEESKGVVWLLGDNIRRLYTVPFGSGHLATVEVDKIKREIKPKFSDGQVSFDVRFSFDSKVQYLDSYLRFGKPLQTEVKQNLLVLLADDISAAITKSQQLYCDYMGFKEKFRVSYPSEVEQLDWESAYADAAFTITVETTLDPGGSIDLEVPVRPESGAR